MQQCLWENASNILAVRLDSMGDVLMTSPALAALRRSPHARVTLLTSASGAEAGRRIDAVDETLVFEAPWMSGRTADTTSKDELALIHQLAERNFDAAVIFTVCTQSALPAALACRLAGIPLRLAHARENPYALLTDWVPERDTCIATARHEVRRQLDLVRHVGFEAVDEHLTLRFGKADTARMRLKLSSAGGAMRQPYIVVHPGASALSRRYPAERYGQVAQTLQERTGCQIIFTGSGAEEALFARAAAHMRQAPISLVGQLEFGELAALIAGAELLLCNNTGPAHMAAALDVPSVVLYAQTNPQHTPWSRRARVLRHDVPCRNCLKSTCPQLHHDCLMRIGPETVVEAACALMSGAPVVGEPGGIVAPAATQPERLGHRTNKARVRQPLLRW